MKNKIKKYCVIVLSALLLTSCTTENKTTSLPSPELEEGIRGSQFGIDKNINEKTIDQYLNREDAVYRDMRMLIDEANYEAIGGDSYLSGYVEGFEIVPYPYLVNVEGLPEEVGTSYQGETLFSHNEDGYHANFEESMSILEDLFPKDKTIFLMCGGGGYAGMTKNMLIDLGWDANKIYNTGGYWFYEGSHKVQIKHEENGKAYYDFHKVNYHPILFSALHKLNQDSSSTGPKEETKIDTKDLPSISLEEIEEKKESGDTFALYITLAGCTSCAKFSPLIERFNEEGYIDIYEISLATIKERSTSFLKDKVEYTPSVLLFKDKEILASLSP
ncbi:MAG: hypothetical protein IJ875_04205, partial [Solobacterium sp.]|nr:hypothetical protein [Solobacterium sp.]